MKLIINADDLGQGHEINAAIKRYAEKGLITSSTILANGPGFDEAKSVVKSCPHISYGIHLNLTEFLSITQSDVLKERGFTDETGCFGSISAKGKVAYDIYLKKAIYDEWVAQIETIYDNGIEISHIDGHHFIHLKPELFDVLKKVQKKFKIRKVRTSYNSIYNSRFLWKTSNKQKTSEKAETTNKTQNEVDTPPPSPHIIKKIFGCVSKEFYSYKLRHYYKTKTPDLFFSYLAMFRLLESGVAFPENLVVELMAHPGGDGCDWFHVENKLIENKSIPNMVKKHKLITYREI